MLLFKHLVESKGLTIFSSLANYETEKFVWRKMNKYLENLLLEIYEKSEEK